MTRSYNTTSVFFIVFLVLKCYIAVSFSTKNSFDRFRASCPADLNCIQQFDPNIRVDGKDEVWCAVYRSSNNLPSVILRDDFLNSMKIATSTAEMSLSASSSSVLSINTRSSSSIPVAVARLRKCSEKENDYILDSMRCILKKENTDKDCDGGSEHKEALSVCIDTLLLHHLRNLNEDKQKSLGKNALRCKATLVSAPLLEERGFMPVQELNKEMTTHIFSDLDRSMERYGARVTDYSSVKSPAARDRALQILSFLGQLDPIGEDKKRDDEGSSSQEVDDYDPWANIKKFI